MTTQTLIRPMDEAISLIETARDVAHAASLQPDTKITLAAQNIISGVMGNQTICGDIRDLSWGAEHNWSMADSRSWILLDGDKSPLKKGYTLVVSLEDASSADFAQYSERKFKGMHLVDVHFNVVVMVRKNLIRRIFSSDKSKTRKIYDVTSLKSFWK